MSQQQKQNDDHDLCDDCIFTGCTVRARSDWVATKVTRCDRRIPAYENNKSNSGKQDKGDNYE
jgi:hypothetical protein